MNYKNKNDCKQNPSTSAFNIKCSGESSIRLTYLEYLKEPNAQKFTTSAQRNGVIDRGIYEGLVRRENMRVTKLANESTSSKSEKAKELLKLHKENAEDDFMWIEEDRRNDNSKGNSVTQTLRKYFLQIFEWSERKSKTYRQLDNIVDEFVVMEPQQEQDWHMSSKLKDLLNDFTAGTLAGIAQVFVSQPLDTVKVKLQTFPKLYKNMFKCFLNTYQVNGIIRGLYAGTLPAVLASIAENSILFTTYGACQKLVAFITQIDKVDELSPLGNAYAGVLAAFFTTFTLCPAELIKCKLQAVHEMKPYVAKSSKAPTISTFKLTRDIFVNEGIPGLYRGLSSTFVRDMPGCFFFFGGYEATREFFTQIDQTKDDIGPLKTMCAGAVGGVALWTFTFPADVIKSRIQINNIKGSMLSVGSDILRKEGVSALYNGLLPTILRTIPATATLFLVYEYSKRILVDK